MVQELRSSLRSRGLSAFDLVFIDHEKSVYLSDLQLLIKEGLIRYGHITDRVGQTNVCQKSG